MVRSLEDLLHGNHFRLSERVFDLALDKAGDDVASFHSVQFHGQYFFSIDAPTLISKKYFSVIKIQ